MICICKSGRNPTMRHIGRTHRIAVSWLNEVLGKEEDKITSDDAAIWYTQSDRMRADIYTKSFTDAAKWKHATRMIGMSTMKEVEGLVQEMIGNFKSEPDLPKEPKSEENATTKSEVPAPKGKAKPKSKSRAPERPRNVASPAVPRRSSPSSCLLLSALLGMIRGQGGEGAQVYGADRHDISSLPYLPEGGVSAPPAQLARGFPAPQTPAITLTTTSRTPTSPRTATCK